MGEENEERTRRWFRGRPSQAYGDGQWMTWDTHLRHCLTDYCYRIWFNGPVVIDAVPSPLHLRPLYSLPHSHSGWPLQPG